MAKKKKNLLNASSRRSREKFTGVMRSFNWMMLLYFLLVVICVLVGRSGEYELGEANVHGFALWFLLIPAYFFLGVMSVVNCLGNFNWNCDGWEAELLGICDMLLGIVLWIIVRLRGCRWGVQTVRNIRTFVLIVCIWGMFQLGCGSIMWLWKRGGFATFHRHLDKKNAPGTGQTGK